MAENTSTDLASTMQCGECGKVMPRGGHRLLYCEPCKTIVRRRHARTRAAVKRVPKVHNRDCRRCASPFRTADPYNYYCEGCIEAAAKSGLSKYHFLSRRADPVPIKGRCQGCFGEFLPRWKGQKYCHQACKAKARRLTPEGRLNSRMQCAVRRGLLNGKEGRSWKALVEFSAEDLRRHLERQFLKGMSWDNFGDWHIDHRRPLSSFRFNKPEDPDFKAAWALTNLQPLWALDNIRKHNRMTFLL